MNSFPNQIKGRTIINQNFLNNNKPAAIIPGFKALTPKVVARSAPIPAAATLSPDFQSLYYLAVLNLCIFDKFKSNCSW